MTAETDNEIDRIMVMSDDEILAEAIREYGSEKAVNVIVGLQKRIIGHLIEISRLKAELRK